MSFRRCDVVPEQVHALQYLHLPFQAAIFTMPVERLCHFCRGPAVYQQLQTNSAIPFASFPSSSIIDHRIRI